MWVLPVRRASYELGKSNSNIPGLTQTRFGYVLDYTWVLPRGHESKAVSKTNSYIPGFACETSKFELGMTNSNIPGLTQTRCVYGLDYKWVLPLGCAS